MNEWDLKSLFWHSNFSNIFLKVGWKLIYKSSIFLRLKPVVYSKESIILKLLEKHLLGILARSTEFLAHMNTLLIWQAWCRHNTHRNVCLGHIKWRVKEVSSSLKSKQKNYTIVCLHIQLPSTRERNKKICHVVVLGPSPFLLGFQVEI